MFVAGPSTVQLVAGNERLVEATTVKVALLVSVKPNWKAPLPSTVHEIVGGQWQARQPPPNPVRLVQASTRGSAEDQTLIAALVHHQGTVMTTTQQNGIHGSFRRLRHFAQQSRNENESHEIETETQTDRLCSPRSGCWCRFGSDASTRIQHAGRRYDLQSDLP
jgi:hypothetical protein